MVTQTGYTSKKIEKALNKAIKKILAQHQINPTTKKGNKQLKFFLSKIAQRNFPNLEEADRIGEQLGEQIVSICTKSNKKILDRGVVVQLANISSIESLIPTFPEEDKQTLQAPVAQDSFSEEVLPPPSEPSPETEEALTAQDGVSEEVSAPPPEPSPETEEAVTAQDGVSEEVSPPPSEPSPETEEAVTAQDSVSDEVSSPPPEPFPEVQEAITLQDNVSDKY